LSRFDPPDFSGGFSFYAGNIAVRNQPPQYGFVIARTAQGAAELPISGQTLQA
jgi:hypothetical protein